MPTLFTFKKFKIQPSTKSCMHKPIPANITLNIVLPHLIQKPHFLWTSFVRPFLQVKCKLETGDKDSHKVHNIGLNSYSNVYTYIDTFLARIIQLN